MDTNTVALINALLAEKNSSPNAWIIGLGMVIAALMPTLASLAAYIQARAVAQHTSAITKEVAAVHVAVNSERSLMQAELKAMNSEILRISGDNKALVERERTPLAPAVVVQAPSTDKRLRELIAEEMELKSKG